MKRDPWKLVTDEAQLRAGMTVELRPCQACGRRHRRILLGERPASDKVFNHAVGGYVRSHSARAWTKAGGCADGFGATQYGRAIRERRLYALIDDDTAVDETTVTRRREMVK